jgi:hypothetical protein
MKKIILSVTKNESDSLAELSEANKAKLVKKNNGKCQACGIDVTLYNHFHEEDNKIHVLCPLCYYPLHLDKIVTKNPGQIILLPEMSQIELNATLRAMEYIKLKRAEYIEQKKDEYAEVADAIEIIEVLLKERMDMADTYYSQGISNINLLGQVLFSFSDEDYAKRETGLYGLKLMHNMDNFGREMKAWEESLSKYKPEVWKKMIEKVAKSQK